MRGSASLPRQSFRLRRGPGLPGANGHQVKLLREVRFLVTARMSGTHLKVRSPHRHDATGPYQITDAGVWCV
jgi:hypothetical protein